MLICYDVVTVLSCCCSCCRSLRGLSRAQAVINFFIQFLFRPNGQYKNCWQMTMTRWSRTDRPKEETEKKNTKGERRISSEEWQMAVNGQWHKTNGAYVFYFLLTAPRHGCVCVCAEKLSFDTCQNALSCLCVCVCVCFWLHFLLSQSARRT